MRLLDWLVDKGIPLKVADLAMRLGKGVPRVRRRSRGELEADLAAAVADAAAWDARFQGLKRSYDNLWEASEKRYDRIVEVGKKLAEAHEQSKRLEQDLAAARRAESVQRRRAEALESANTHLRFAAAGRPFGVPVHHDTAETPAVWFPEPGDAGVPIAVRGGDET